MTKKSGTPPADNEILSSYGLLQTEGATTKVHPIVRNVIRKFAPPHLILIGVCGINCIQCQGPLYVLQVLITKVHPIVRNVIQKYV